MTILNLSNRVLVTFAGCLIATLPTECLADGPTWNGWLGPNRDGWVTDFVAPSIWPEELTQEWELEVGEGYGSPLVNNGRVYQHARQGENEVLICADLTSGKELWKSQLAVPFKMGGGGEWHGKGPKSSPALANGRIFTFSINGVLVAWDENSGDQLWKKDYSSEFKGLKTPYWGMSISPLVIDERVIAHFGNDDQGFLAALDVESGKEIWRSGKDGADYSSPLFHTIDGVPQIVEWNHNGLAGIAPETGKRLWFFSLPHIGSDQNMPTPAILNGVILVGGENRGVRAVQPKLENGTWKATELWHQKDVALDMSSAVVNGEFLYGFSHYDKGRLFCLNPTDGKIQWKGPGRTGQNVTFLAFPGHLAALIDNGELRILEASAGSYRVIKTYQVSETPTWAPPVLLQDGLLVKARTNLSYLKF